MGEYFEERIKHLEDTIDRQAILIELVYHTLMPHGTDKIFNTPPPPPRRKRSRSRSRSPPPPNAPRKESYHRRRRSRSRSPKRSNTIIHVKGWQNGTLPEDVVNYIENLCGIYITSCSVDNNGTTGKICCFNADDQRVLLGERANEIMGRFGFKVLEKRLVH